MIPKLFHDPVSTALRTSLSGLQMRQQAIANNVANVDTPNYKAKAVAFEDALAAELKGPPSRAPKLFKIGLDTTHDKHFPVAPRVEKFVATPTTFDSADGTMRNDGNNVDVEREMTKLAETQILYSAMGQLQQGRYGTIRGAINEGRR